MASIAAPARETRVTAATTRRIPPARAGTWHGCWTAWPSRSSCHFVIADQLGLQRDIYLVVYIAAVIGLFVSWALNTGLSLREIFTGRWRLAVGLGVVFAGIGAVIAIGAEDGSGHPDGIEFIGALLWRGTVYGAADGLLLSAFPTLLVFAALKC
jgi:hypothetical protein